MEELLPKDNENVPLHILTTDGPGEGIPEPFAPEQMVRCDECLRANPPTRVNCLYCAAVLPISEATVNLQKPALRPLEKWEQGYNTILLPSPAHFPGELANETLREAADVLQLPPADLALMISLRVPLPLARAATIEDASLVERRLGKLGFNTRIMSDTDPGSGTTTPIKVRALEIDETQVFAFQTPEAPAFRILWTDFVLFVVGRLTVKRVELKEQKNARVENRILEASEFVTDETAVDLYTREQATPYRITANSFDFSCLGKNKGLLASENISRLINVFREHAPSARFDDSFNSLRKVLEAVWPSEQQNESSGWRRERPGKYSIGSVTELSNEMQFLRYSRLRYYFNREADTDR